MNVGFAENGEVTSVEGNSCGRGKKYAQAEAINPGPHRVRYGMCSGCLEPVSYRTSAPVPKALAGDVARKAVSLSLCAPIASGDVICENVCGTGISLIATKSIG